MKLFSVSKKPSSEEYIFNIISGALRDKLSES